MWSLTVEAFRIVVRKQGKLNRSILSEEAG